MSDETNRAQRIEDLLWDLETEIEELIDLSTPELGKRETFNRTHDMILTLIEEIRKVL